jgi:phage gpG-like protein
LIQFDVTIDQTAMQRIAIQISEKVKTNLQLALRYSALEVYNGARDKCPVVTGNLRGSINIKYVFEYPNYAAFIGTNVEYAADQEFNDWYNHHHEKQKNSNAQWGFFRKSLAEVEPTYRERVANVLSGGGL